MPFARMRWWGGLAFMLAALGGCGTSAKGPTDGGGEREPDDDDVADAADGGEAGAVGNDGGGTDVTDAGGVTDASDGASGSCTPLGPAPSGPRPSSLRTGDCDYGEWPDFTTFDLFCDPDQSCPPPTQEGDQLCHRVCDDGMCAAGEQCEKRVIYVSDTPSRYANLCRCAASGCAPPAAPAPEGGLESWRADAPLPLDLYYHAAAAGPGRLYVSGGLTIDKIESGGTSTSLEVVDQVLVGTLDGDGRVTAWMHAGTLPAPLYLHAMAVAQGRLYVSGGGQQAFRAAVTSAAILPDGTLGPWRTEAPMPGGRSWHRLLAAGGSLVVAGGSEMPDYFTNGTTAIAVAALGADGVVGAWTQTFAPSPVFYDGGAGVARGRLYVLGEDGVLRSAALPALDGWRAEVTWRSVRSPLSSMSPTDANMGPVNLFEQCGALVAVIVRGETLSAPLDDDGVVGPWRIASRFHGTDSGFAAAATPDGLYATGGVRLATRVVDVWSTRRR